MNEGDFTNNFTWFEWGFVSPEDLPSEDVPPARQDDTHGYTVPNGPRDTWKTEQRWTT